MRGARFRIALFPIRNRAQVRKPMLKMGSLVAFLSLYYFLVRKSSHVFRPSHIAVCVTGQMCRLQLESKYVHFFQPLAQRGELSIALVLQTGDECIHLNTQSRLDERDQFSSMHEIKQWFYERQLKANMIKYETASGEHEFVQPRYVYTLNKLGRRNSTQRALVHFRQWKSYELCWRALPHHADVYIRMRDDSNFFRTFSFPTLLEHQRPLVDVIVPECCNWDGLNDKIAIFFGARAAESLLTNTLRIYKREYDDLVCPLSTDTDCVYKFRTHNPETFLQQVTDALELKVAQVDYNRLPHVAAISNNGHICIESPSRQVGSKSCIVSLRSLAQLPAFHAEGTCEIYIPFV